MADHFTQGAFAFTCSISEAALIEEAWQIAADLMGDFEPDPISDELKAVFPPTIADKPLSGFAAIFDDANFPDFGAEIRVANSSKIRRPPRSPSTARSTFSRGRSPG
jgi:hypothetical protein